MLSISELRSIRAARAAVEVCSSFFFLSDDDDVAWSDTRCFDPAVFALFERDDGSDDDAGLLLPWIMRVSSACVA